MPPQRAGPKHLVPDQRPGLKPKPKLSHLLQKMLTGFATPRQMIAAVARAAHVEKAVHAARAARRAGRAMGVARVPRALGRDVGREVPWSGGLSLLMAGLLLVEVRAAGNGMMMIPASGECYATRNGWPQLLLPRLLLPLGLVRRLRGHLQPCFRNCK